ncbi:hypothetical protein NLG07_00565 [Alteromonas sp. LMIT006]|uniref:hypothetical protein n=1 Tax=Alteromonadaceae TaxID=72275 RepID=UPI0020CA2E46|nr:hypothetical protein [Alteromonas sp. LMIT006]UTP72766.1 hypothetical protein NLG07_00565 [Alteromonas sp. LMIT006]
MPNFFSKKSLQITIITLGVALSFSALSNTIEYQCSFNKTVNYKGEVLESYSDIRFVEDVYTGEAVMIGNNGMSNVSINEGRLKTYIEANDSGAISTTTILENGKAIHYRVSSLPGTDLHYSAMLYGQCDKK